MPTKPKLAREIAEQLRQRRISVREFAASLGVSPNSLGSWITRNRFPVDHASAIAKSLGFNADVARLHEQFEFDVTRSKRPNPTLSLHTMLPQSDVQRSNKLEKALEMIDGRMDYFGRACRDFDKDCVALFSSMSENDVFVYWSINKLPFEFTPTGILTVGEAIANALLGGAVFLYLYPAWSPPNSHSTETRIFEDHATYFKTTIAGLRQNSDATVNKNVIYYSVTNPNNFIFPNAKFVLLKSGGASLPRAMGQFPTGAKMSPEPLHLPLDDQCTGEFIDFIKAALLAHKTETNAKRVAKLLGGNVSA